MCLRCDAVCERPFCDPCVLVLEQFDVSYRTGVRLASVEGWKALKRESRYVSKKL